jgi:hypothetical protein
MSGWSFGPWKRENRIIEDGDSFVKVTDAGVGVVDMVVDGVTVQQWTVSGGVSIAGPLTIGDTEYGDGYITDTGPYEINTASDFDVNVNSGNGFKVYEKSAGYRWAWSQLGFEGGTQDVQAGFLYLYGHAAGSGGAGGQIVLWTAEDASTELGYIMQPVYDDLHIGPSGDQDALKYDRAANRWAFTNGSNGIAIGSGVRTQSGYTYSGEYTIALGSNYFTVSGGYLRVGVQNSVQGNLYLYGGATDNGPNLNMWLPDGFNSTISLYSISIYEDDWRFGPSTNPDSFKYIGGEGSWEYEVYDPVEESWKKVLDIDSPNSTVYIGNQTQIHARMGFDSDPHFRIMSGTDAWLDINASVQYLGRTGTGNEGIEVNQSGGYIKIYSDGVQEAQIDSAGLTLKTGASVNEIETTITNDDTHIPTSGSVVDYAAPIVHTHDKIEEGNSYVEVVDAGTGLVSVVADGYTIATFGAQYGIRVGGVDGNFGRLVHDSGVLYITNQYDSGDVIINGQIAGPTSKQMARFRPDGAVDIGYNGTVEFETKSGGIKIPNGGLETDTGTPVDLTVSCGSNKTIVLNEPVWDIYVFHMSTIRLGGTNPASEYAYRGALAAEYPDNLDANVYVTIQLPHSYKPGTDIEVYVHWTTDGDGAGAGAENIEWVVTSSASTATLDGSESWPVETTHAGAIVDVQDWVQHEHHMTQIATIDGTNFGIDEVILISIRRNTAVANNSPLHAIVVSTDVRFQKDTLGSRQKYVK